MLLAGTTDHLEDLDRQYTLAEDVRVDAVAVAVGATAPGGPATVPAAPAAPTAPTAAYVLLDGQRVARVEAFELAPVVRLPHPTGQSLAAGADLLVAGTAGAHLATLDPATGSLAPVTAFDGVDGRGGWHNPGSAPPDLRSIAVTASGTWLAAVHVGGVWRSIDRGATWANVVPADADVHEVVAGVGGRVAAAAATGLGWSGDDGVTWRWTADGLHGAYARAVALDGDIAYLTASTGPRSGDGRLYRGRLGSPLVACTAGLPPSFPFNLDTGSLAARDGEVALGTRTGEVFRSGDAGATFDRVTERLPPVRVLRFA